MATLVEPTVSQMTVRPLSLDEYHWLIEQGFFAEDEHVELVQGVLHSMSPEGPRHVAVIDRLLGLFFGALGSHTQVRVQHPLRLPDSNSEPEPDLVLAEKREDTYSERHPVPSEVFLVIEVAATSLEEDRRLKIPLYAAAGIIEFWIVNLVEDQIEIYREPTIPVEGAAYYRQRLHHSAQDIVHPIQFPDCSFAVKDVLRTPDRG